MIKLANIRKSFNRVSVLEGVSLTVNAGERVSVTGISGSGKTTLLRLVAGLDTPDGGEIHIEKDMASTAGKIVVPPHQRHIGFVFQTPSLWPHLTVAQNVMFGLGGMPRKPAINRLRHILSETGIDHLSNRSPGTLSGGEQRRVAIARTLAPEPRALLMDEPLTNLDPASKDEIAMVIRGVIVKRSLSLIYVTHDCDEAQYFCDRHLCINERKIESRFPEVRLEQLDKPR